MGQYGSARVVYGWALSEDDIEKINGGSNEDEDDCTDDVIDDWAEESGLDLEVGGNLSYDWREYVVGIAIPPWISDLGVHEIDDDFGEVDISVHEKLKPFVEHFGREPKKYLVLSYG